MRARLNKAYLLAAVASPPRQVRTRLFAVETIVDVNAEGPVHRVRIPGLLGEFALSHFQVGDIVGLECEVRSSWRVLSPYLREAESEITLVVTRMILFEAAETPGAKPNYLLIEPAEEAAHA